MLRFLPKKTGRRQPSSERSERTLAENILRKRLRRWELDISHSPIKTGNTVKAAVNIIDGDRVWDPNYFKEKNWVGTAFPPMLSENDMEYVKGFDLVHGSCYSRLEDQFLRIAGLGPLLSFDFMQMKRSTERTLICRRSVLFWIWDCFRASICQTGKSKNSGKR